MENASDLFDQYAGGYEAALDEGLKVTGENPAYFAEGRVKWMQRWLDRLEATPRRILDFGCGTGGSVPFLLKLKGVEEIVGVDVSDASLNVARERYTDPRVQFHRPSDFSVEGSIDLAFCNGVFHHIPPADRPACVRYIHTTLRPGGLLFYQTFTRTAVSDAGPQKDEWRLADGELLTMFAPLRPVVYREEGRIGALDRGFRDKALLVAVKEA